LSISDNSVSSNTTTQETGHLYTEGFSEGFMAQNVNFLQNDSWLGEEMLIKRSNGKRNRKGEDVLEDLGDIDFLGRTKSEVRVQELFPAAARCDIDSISTIPAGWDLYIEVTSMFGNIAVFNEQSEVANK
jgi:hypothetical protein